MHTNPHIKDQVLKDKELDGLDVHSRRLANVLESYKLSTLNMPKDGDCLFSSISAYILQHQGSLSGQLIQHLQNIGIS